MKKKDKFKEQTLIGFLETPLLIVEVIFLVFISLIVFTSNGWSFEYIFITSLASLIIYLRIRGHRARYFK